MKRDISLQQLTQTQKQFLLFLIVGSINTIFSYCLYAIFISLHLHYSLAIFLATSLGILFNFQTTGRIVFQNRKKNLFLHFVFLYAFLYCINVLLVKLIHQYIDNLYIVGAIVSILMAGFSFYMNKRFVFKTTELAQ